ncbi:MAG: CAP domain-containing protein [Sedimenticolaceae bacterium]
MSRTLNLVLGITFCLQSAAWAGDPAAALQSHNQVRKDVNAGDYPGQPVADPPLPLLNWDQPLADSAEAYAKQCVWAHSNDRVNEGENLAYSTGLDFSIGEAVGLWADEYRGYDFATGACSISACGHYTQLVWQNTLLVGCGDTVCAPLRSSSGTVLANQARYHVCRYATAGNINGEPPYVIDGGDPTVIADYSERTQELTVPYALIWQPSNLVQPVGAVFELVSVNPIRFALRQALNEDYRDDLHVSIYDVRSARLFLPELETLLGGVWQRHSAVLRTVPGSTPFQVELEYFR